MTKHGGTLSLAFWSFVGVWFCATFTHSVKPYIDRNNPGCFEKEAENKIFQMLTDDARWRTKTDTYVGNIGV